MDLCAILKRDLFSRRPRVVTITGIAGPLVCPQVHDIPTFVVASERSQRRDSRAGAKERILAHSLLI